jgi:uncharacterized protein (DUF305 family)
MTWRDTIVRRRRRRNPVGVLVALAALALGCAGGDDPAGGPEGTAPVVQLGGPGETNRVLTSAEIDELDVPGHTDADVAFAHGMIAHHEQALVMTAMVAGRAERDDLAQFAERIEVSQHDEITQLEAWLSARGKLQDGEAHVDHDELMPGMLTADELAQLEAASGRRFDELFLQYMIRHHEGAVAMVEELLTGGTGGQEPNVFQLAQHIELDQQVEIARMKQLLTESDTG